jgi:hypothetical protein
MRRKYLTAAASLAALLVGAASAQDPAPGRTQEESTRAFLAHKHQLQNERSGRIADAANLGALNAMVRAVAVTPPAPGFVDKGNLAALNDSFLVDVAQTLAVLGFKAGDLRSSAEASAAYVQAAAARIRGGATLDQEKLLADTVVTGTVARTVAEDLGDGFRSTVEIVVDRPVKGAAKAGETIRLRRQSGKGADNRVLKVSTEDSLADGAKVALIASNARYQNDFGARGRPCALCVVEQVPAFLVDGQNVVPTGGYGLGSTVAAFTNPSK